ncbi:MAG: hypothetical protein ABSE84_31450, partial [Isosphaeraceae bacterium]
MNPMKHTKTLWSAAASMAALCATSPLHASEADIKIPDLRAVSFLGGSLSGNAVLMAGLVVCVIGLLFGWVQYAQTKKL